MQTQPALPGPRIHRRRFLSQTIAAAALSSIQLPAADPPAKAAPWRAAILGYTGRGNYGHGLDVVFNGRKDIQVVAVADPDSTGRVQAMERIQAGRAYADYRELLAKEKPGLVCLASRWSEHHREMGMAALDIGAHLLTEKPLTPTLAEADELLSAADRAGRKIAVAHQMRLAPSMVGLKKALTSGLVGELLHMHAWGKQDQRAGGEDMLVLGSHLFDLMRFFAGDAVFCTARVLQRGVDITRADGHTIQEQIGRVAGDEIDAQFAFAGGVQGTFTSRTRLRDRVNHWGIELVGSKGSARILADVFPAVHVLKSDPWNAEGRADQWRRWEEDPGAKLDAEQRGFEVANRRLVDDWLDAIRTNREPVCSGRNAMKSLEMIMAVYHAALSGRRVPLPLADRSHPLGS